MDQRGVFYVSRLKLNNRIYQKNPEPEFFRDGSLKKQTEYLPLDLEEIMHSMQPGDTVEMRDTYIGKDKKLPARVVLYRLTDVQVRKRRKDQAYKEKKKGIIELVFKTWKSFFQMDRCKEVKRERLECHLYGQLIAILICSSTLFRMRELLLREKQRELSEYKAFYMIQTYFPKFHQALQQENTQTYTKILLRLFHLLGKNGWKSHRYKKKTVFDILGVVYEYTISPAKVA
jgi:hypothetical protein